MRTVIALMASLLALSFAGSVPANAHPPQCYDYCHSRLPISDFTVIEIAVVAGTGTAFFMLTRARASLKGKLPE